MREVFDISFTGMFVPANKTTGFFDEGFDIIVCVDVEALVWNLDSRSIQGHTRTPQHHIV